jgi:hypothetical protein
MRVSQFKDRVDSLLAQSLLDLSMTLAVLARIENNNFEIVAVRSNSVAYVPGEKFELGDSYSRDVFEQQKIIADTQIEKSARSLHHPLYRALPLESYIGAPILSSMALHDKAFSERDLKLVETLASEISQLLSYTEPRMAAL